MKRGLVGLVVLAALFPVSCAITNYPVITDDRGDFSGVIRTGHKAYIRPDPFGSVATVWSDGSEELFTMVSQNNYGDQVLYGFNNFDPTASVIFLDQTYCDWRYEGCEFLRAWNPHQDNIDDIFDYEYFPDCSGARSLSDLVSYSSRLGECGDGLFAGNQDLAAEFANLATTTWRGGTAYIVPCNANTMSITLDGTQLPIYGQVNSMLTPDLNFVSSITPNVRHSLRWLLNWTEQHGPITPATIRYGSFSMDVSIKFHEAGIRYNLSRF
ncbi:MAG: hypothetical protein U0V87_10900 [Acidobacteriota bacterium]